MILSRLTDSRHVANVDCRRGFLETVMRRPKMNRVPKTRAGNTWTNAGWWGFLRSGLRQLSTRWPPLRNVVKAHRRPYVGPNKRQKFEVQCADCEQWYKASETHVDHIIPCGSLKSFDDVQGFVERCFCEADGLRVLCTQCHQVRTNSQRESKRND